MTRKIIGIALLALLIAGGGLFFIADSFYMLMPKDIVVLRALQAHRETFERMRQMVIEDSNVASMFTGSDLNENLTQERRAEYRRLFAQLPAGIVVTTHKQSARFVFATGGLLSIGPEWIKGVEYLPSAPTDWGKLVDNLDNPSGLAMGNVYLRPAQDQWYIFLQKTD